MKVYAKHMQTGKLRSLEVAVLEDLIVEIAGRTYRLSKLRDCLHIYTEHRQAHFPDSENTLLVKELLYGDEVQLGLR